MSINYDGLAGRLQAILDENDANRQDWPLVFVIDEILHDLGRIHSWVFDLSSALAAGIDYAVRSAEQRNANNADRERTYLYLREDVADLIGWVEALRDGTSHALAA